MLPVAAGCWAEIEMGKRSGRASASAETRPARREHRVIDSIPPSVHWFTGRHTSWAYSEPSPRGLETWSELSEPAESDKGGSVQKSAEGTPTNLAAPCHTVTEMVLRQLPPAVGGIAYSAQEVLHGRDYPDDLLELGSLIHSGRLVPRHVSRKSPGWPAECCPARSVNPRRTVRPPPGHWRWLP